MGSPTAFMNRVREYWISEYDWRKHEAKLNAFSHFKCILEDHENIDIHFIHQQGKAPKKSVPILLLHGMESVMICCLSLLLSGCLSCWLGWPGSVWEFYKVIPMLVQQGYEVVVPSLPGYGFSSAPETPGWSLQRIASAFNSLMMNKLGYKKYFVQGGDWGSSKFEWRFHYSKSI